MHSLIKYVRWSNVVLILLRSSTWIVVSLTKKVHEILIIFRPVLKICIL